MVLCLGATEGLTGSGSGYKLSSDGDQTQDPWVQGEWLIHYVYTKAAHKPYTSCEIYRIEIASLI